MTYKEFLSALAIIITFYAFFPYIRSILEGKTKPHAFSWIIWGSSTIVVFWAQLSDNGGVGAWPIGVSGLITLYVAFLAFSKKADTIITKMDWFFLSFALASLPIWYYTSNPLWAVVILTTIDVMGFGPTIRKAYSHPYDERMGFYLIFVFRNLISILALENYSFTTILFPAATGLSCIFFIKIVFYRRWVLSRI